MTTLSDAAHLASLLADRGADGVRRELAEWHAFDIAETLAELDGVIREAVLRALPVKRQAEVFGYLQPEDQLAFARALRRPELGAVFAAMDPDERADLFKRLPEDDREAILPGLAQAEREDIRKLASYGEDTVGSVMTSHYVTVRPGMSVGEAFAHLRREAPDRETIYDAFVIDEERRVVGVVSLRDIIIAPPGARIADVMKTEVVTVSADAPRAEAATLIEQYDLIALPVVNGGEKLVGIVTADDAIDVIEARTTDTFQKQAALSLGRREREGEGVINVLEATLATLWRVRIVWLVLLVFGNILSGFGIAAFEDMIAANVALVFFLPLLIASGGNAGSQASTLMVRALATGDVGIGDYVRLVSREVVVAAMLGGTMALAVSLIGFWRGGPEIALIVALAMVAIVIAGSLIGMSLPFVLSRLGGDPATSSAPLVTSIADVIGVLAYLGIASVVLGRMAG
jgi:magnesium transporter